MARPLQIAVFSDVLSIVNGKNQKSVEAQDGKYPIYGSGGIMGRANAYLCEANTVIIGRKGSINNPIFVGEPFWNVDTAFGLVADQKKLLPSYLYYFCVKFDFTKLNTTVTIPSLTKANLLKVQIPLPPLAEQKRIAEELDNICAAKKDAEAIVEKLKLLAKSQFVEMFGLPLSDESAFPVKTIGDIATEVRYGTSRPAVEGGKYVYLRMNNLTLDGQLDLGNIKHITVPEEELEKCIVRKGDLLFNRTNSKELVGKTALFNLDEPMIIAGYIIRVRFTPNVLPLYVAQYMNLPQVKKLLTSMSKGAVNQANISAKELQTIRIPVPPLALQRQYAAFIEQLDKSVFALKESLSKLTAAQKALMNQAFEK